MGMCKLIQQTCMSAWGAIEYLTSHWNNSIHYFQHRRQSSGASGNALSLVIQGLQSSGFVFLKQTCRHADDMRCDYI